MEGYSNDGRRLSVRDFSHRGALFGVVAVRATKSKHFMGSSRTRRTEDSHPQDGKQQR